MKVRIAVATLALCLLAGCGGTLSANYIQQRMEQEGLKVVSIVPLGAGFGERDQIVFVDSPTEKGCFIVWGVDNNMGFSRVTNERYGSILDPAAAVTVFQTNHRGTDYLCISIHDAALAASVATIEVQYPTFTLNEKATAVQSHYVLSPSQNTHGSKPDAIRLYNPDGTLLYEQPGETK